MHQNLIYTLILLSIYFIGSSQDLIIKKDSSVIEAIVFEVNPDEITYAPFSTKKTKLKIPKNDISKILFRNGTEILFNAKTNLKTDTVLTYYIDEKRKYRPERKPDTLQIGDYIKFNILAGAVINNSDCNRQYDSHQPPGKIIGEGYINKSDYTNTSINIGANILLGASPYIQYIVGVNYLRSKGEFSYERYGISTSGNYITSSYYSELNYKTKVDFINVVSGLRFKTFKGFYIEPLIAINIPVYISAVVNGSETSQSYGKAPTRKIFNDEISHNLPDDLHTISLCPRLSYELKTKQDKLGVYFSYNLALRYKLPWFMAGITYYPLKKLR